MGGERTPLRFTGAMAPLEALKRPDGSFALRDPDRMTPVLELRGADRWSTRQSAAFITAVCGAFWITVAALTVLAVR